MRIRNPVHKANGTSHLSYSFFLLCKQGLEGTKGAGAQSNEEATEAMSMIIFHHFFYGYESETGDVVALPPLPHTALCTEQFINESEYDHLRGKCTGSTPYL
jgi:hypothetical protein